MMMILKLFSHFLHFILYLLYNHREDFMAIVKRANSPLGALIAPAITDFIKQNANASLNDKEMSPDEGAEALGNAIAYGIAKALSSVPVQIAFQAGVATPGGGPVGTLIFTPLSISCKEL